MALRSDGHPGPRSHYASIPSRLGSNHRTRRSPLLWRSETQGVLVERVLDRKVGPVLELDLQRHQHPRQGPDEVCELEGVLRRTEAGHSASEYRSLDDWWVAAPFQVPLSVVGPSERRGAIDGVEREVELVELVHRNLELEAADHQDDGDVAEPVVRDTVPGHPDLVEGQSDQCLQTGRRGAPRRTPPCRSTRASNRESREMSIRHSWRSLGCAVAGGRSRQSGTLGGRRLGAREWVRCAAAQGLSGERRKNRSPGLQLRARGPSQTGATSPRSARSAPRRQA